MKKHLLNFTALIFPMLISIPIFTYAQQADCTKEKQSITDILICSNVRIVQNSNEIEKMLELLKSKSSKKESASINKAQKEWQSSLPKKCNIPANQDIGENQALEISNCLESLYGERFIELKYELLGRAEKERMDEEAKLIERERSNPPVINADDTDCEKFRKVYIRLVYEKNPSQISRINSIPPVYLDKMIAALATAGERKSLSEWECSTIMQSKDPTDYLSLKKAIK